MKPCYSSQLSGTPQNGCGEFRITVFQKTFSYFTAFSSFVNCLIPPFPDCMPLGR